MKKILLIGSGARENIIAEALSSSRHQVELYCFGEAVNPGIKRLCADYKVGNLQNFEEIGAYAKTLNADFAFIGPDNPIGAGLADYLLENCGLKSVAPLKAAAQLESSKAFTRQLMAKYHISGMPKFRVFTNSNGLKEYLTDDLDGDYVVKYDGLLGGKGVKISGEHLLTIDDGFSYAEECLAECGRVVVEAKLVGQEFSLIALCDGQALYHFPLVQDHKRAFDGDQGPNTGGMGTYSDTNGSLPFLSDVDLLQAQKINQETIKAVQAETGIPFTGVLYGGFIATKSGVQLIEYNTRFGDPEVMNLLNLLEDDFVDLSEAVLEGNLNLFEPKFKKLATVCLYAVPSGYPDNSQKGAEIILDKNALSEVKVYFASVNLVEETATHYRLTLTSSRAIAFVGLGNDIETARIQALKGFEYLQGPVSYRTDIGASSVIAAKVDQMWQLRS